jgi:hypothetical protein
MKTDHLFYRLFHEYPELVFDLTGESVPTDTAYVFYQEAFTAKAARKAASQDRSGTGRARSVHRAEPGNRRATLALLLDLRPTTATTATPTALR